MSETHTIKIVVDRTQQKQEIAALNKELAGVGKTANDLARGFGGASNSTNDLSKALRGANDNAKSASSALKGTATSASTAASGFNTLKLGIGLTVAAFAALGVAAVKATAANQSLKASLQVATGSAASASREMERLQKFAAATPFTTEQAVKGFIKLKNLGLDPSEKAMKSYGNTSASMGKDLMQMVEAVADATTGEFERLKEFGIKTKVAGDQVKFTFAGVTTSVKNNSNEIQKYLINLGNTKFAGAMDLQAKTLGGVMSTLKDTADQLLVSFGQGFAGAMFSAADGLSKGAAGMKELAVESGKLVGAGLGMLINALKLVADNATLLGGILTVLATRTIATALVGAIGSAITVFNGLRASMAVAGVAAALAGTQVTAASTAMLGARAAGSTLMTLMGGPWVAAAMALAGAIYFFATRETEAEKATNALKGATVDLNNILRDPSATDVAIKNAENLTMAKYKEAQQTRKQLAAELELAKARYNSALANPSKGSIESAGAYGVQIGSIEKQIAENNAAMMYGEESINSANLNRKLPGMMGRILGGGTSYTPPAIQPADAKATKADTKKYISGEEAIRLLGLDLQNRGFSVTENKNFGGVTTRHAMKDHNTNAIDVNYPGGGRIEHAKLDAEALRLQKLGFTVMWDGNVFAGGGNGPTSKLSGKGPGDAMHRTHLHGEMRGKMEVGGLDPVSIADSKADAAVKAAEVEKDLREGIAQRQKQALEEELSLRAQLASIISGDEVKGKQILADERVRQAVEKEREALLNSHADLSSDIAKKALQEAEARERTKVALEGSVQAAQELGAAMADAKKRNKDRDLAKLSPKDRVSAQFNEERLKAERTYIDVRTEYEKQGDKDKLAAWDANWREWQKDFASRQMDANKQVAMDFASKLSGSISQIGDALAQIIGGKTGEKVGGIFGSISEIVGVLSGPKQDPATWSAQAGDGGVTKLIGGFKDLSGNMSSIFGSGTQMGSFFSKLSGTLGQAGMGAQAGQMITPIGKALWSKFSSTGAQIGGAIGSFLPIPGGQFIGAAVGGVVGGLLKKKPAPGKAGVSFDGFGNLKASASGAGDDKWQGQAQGVADAIASGITNIAGALGGFLDPSSNWSIAVKKKKDYWIKPTMSGKEGKEFKKEEDAIAYAITQALKAGVITGISDFSKRILSDVKAKDLDSTVAVAAGYEKVLDELENIKSPATVGVTQFIKEMERLVTGMQKVGATAEELANVTEYRELHLKEILDDNLDSLKQFKKDLSGEGSGVTELNRLNKDLVEFNEMKSDIAAGRTVDQDKFLELGHEIFDLAGSVYGTSTSAFQDLRSMLMETNDGLIENVTKAFNDATVVAIQQQTAAVEITNSHLETHTGLFGQILDALRAARNNQTTATNGSYDY